MQIFDLMTRDPVAVPPDTDLDTAMRLMDDCAIRHLPVVERNELVGVISDRDLFQATGWGLLGAGNWVRSAGATVENLMQRDVVAVRPEEEAIAAAIEVVLRGVGCLPVISAGALVGIVTEMDLLRLYAELCRDRALDEDLDPEVDVVANHNAVVVSPNATVVQADELCHAKGFRHLPVVDGDELVGILSDRDLRRMLGTDADPETTVESVMTRQVLTVAPDARLSEAARLMVEHKVSSLPVHPSGPKETIGIVTSIDIIDHGSAGLSAARSSAG